ncbi:MAG TPA: pyridoxamine 5'-phosphate oxidase family protein [Acidimicrobiia bacterium]
MLTERPDVCEALDRAHIAHLAAVTPSGQPQTSPVWYLRVGDEIVVYNRPETPRLRSIAGNDRVCLVLRGDRRADGAVIIEGRARVDADMPPCHERPEYLARYEENIIGMGYTPEAFAAEYSVGIIITPTRIRAWGVELVISAEEASG